MSPVRQQDHPIDLFLLRRYVAGSCTPAERARVGELVVARPEYRREVEALRSLYQQSSALLPEVDTGSAWTTLATRVRKGHTPRDGRVLQDRRSRSAAMQRVLRVAKLLPAAAAAGILLVRFVGPRVGLGGAHAREFTSAIGSRTTVVLRDGTHSVLGPASRLRVPADFDNGRRLVQLEGEAIFTVVHDPAHPFMVRAGGAQLQDVGTQFDVRAYAGDQAVQVAVAEGRVDVMGTARAQALRAGDVATIADTVVAIAHGEDVAALMAWTRGDLVFRDTPLRQVMAAIGRWYGLEVRLADPAQGERHRLTARFSNASAPEALRSIAAVAGMSYTLSDRTVTFTEARPTH